MSKEPSMEEILSSIKRIIREEGSTSLAEPRAPRRGRMELVPPVEANDVAEVEAEEAQLDEAETAEDVLELTPPETDLVLEDDIGLEEVTSEDVVADDAETDALVEEPATAEILELTPPDPIVEDDATEEEVALADAEDFVDDAPEALADDEIEAVAEEAAKPEEVLELTEAVDTEATVGLTEALTKKSTDSILSVESEVAARHSLSALSSMVVVPEAGAPSNTLEGMVEGMLRPLIKEWLDANLPTMVESMVAKEITRITGGVR